MSMHIKPITLSEEAGLRAHGLPVGEPSQLADAFRLGMAWGKAEFVRKRIAVAKTRGSLVTRAMRHPVVLEIMADCADCMDAENSASCDPAVDLYSSKLLGEAKELRAEAAQIRSEDPELWKTLPALAVWFGSMPESNGKTNWTAILYRRDGSLMDGITIDRSEYKDRVRYEADRLRWLIGELEHRPDILTYDAELREEVQQAGPVRLTDAEIEHLWYQSRGVSAPFARAIETSILERNGLKPQAKGD